MGLNLPQLPPQIPIKFPSSLETKLIDESFYTTGVAAQIPIFVPSTWYLYSARQKGEEYQ